MKKSLTVLKPGGLLLCLVGPPDTAFATQIRKPLLKPVMALMSRKIRAQAKKIGVRYEFFFMKANGIQLEKLAILYESGALRPVIDKLFPFENTLDAMAYMERGHAKGKVVIDMMPLNS